mgnify:CR=1 FL=1
MGNDFLNLFDIQSIHSTAPLPDAEQRLSVFHIFSVFDIDVCDETVLIALDLIHQFHCLYDCKRLPLFTASPACT